MKSNIKPTDYSYTAGYIDGDGCFYIGIERSKKRLKPKYVMGITISSVNKGTLDTFKKQFGGCVSLVNEAHDNSKPLYQFTIKKSDTINLIQCLLPYLVEKKEEALIALKFGNLDNIQERVSLITHMKVVKEVSNLVSKYHKTELEQFKNAVEPSEEDFAYLAGFIDAECCLGIQKYRIKNKPNFIYKIQLQCNNTKAPVFKWLLERFGGQIHFIDRRNHGKARRNQLCWRLSGKALSKILNKIHPFLRYKKPVCEELMKFYQTTLNNGGDRHTKVFRSQYEEVLKLREIIVDKVHKLNLKGLSHLSG